MNAWLRFSTSIVFCEHFHCLVGVVIFSISLIHAWTTFHSIYIIFDNFGSASASWLFQFQFQSPECSYYFCLLREKVASLRTFELFVRAYEQKGLVREFLFVVSRLFSAVIMCSIGGSFPFFDTYACPHAEAMLQRECHSGSYIAVCALRSLYNDSLVD